MKMTWFNKAAFSLVALSLVATQPVFSQDTASELRNELSQEIDGLYPKATLRKKSRKDLVAQKELDLDQDSKTKSTTIINNNYAPKADEKIEQQPETVVEAAPLSESRVGKVKKSRSDFERSTEDTLVEKLEQDRINAERERAKRAEELFNKKEEVVKEAPVVEVAPAPIVQPVVQPIVVQHVDPVNTSATAVEDVEKTKPKDEKAKFYVSAAGGVGDYATAKNVKGVYAAGVSGGIILDNSIAIELSAMFSSYDVTETRYDFFSNTYFPSDVQMDQQNFTLSGKYLFLDGRVRPLVGALVSYTHRTFENRFANPYGSPYGAGYGYPYANNNNFNQNVSRPSSWSIDGGLLVGADVKISESFFLGADVRYLTNLSYRRDRDPRDVGYYGVFSNGFGTPIEELSYYLFTVNGGFRF
jgi:outer membrane protein W